MSCILLDVPDLLCLIIQFAWQGSNGAAHRLYLRCRSDTHSIPRRLILYDVIIAVALMAIGPLHYGL